MIDIEVKHIISTVIGMIGGAIASLYGGWTSAMTTLLIFMIIDYFTGLVVAGVFKKSDKSETGALESRAGFKGICRKCMILLMLLVACRLDIALNTTYIKDAVCIAFIANETISIVENAGLMGIPIPKAIMKAIDILNSKEDETNDKRN